LTAEVNGGSSQATLKWQSGTSVNGPWTDISGATTASYQPSTSVAGTFFYRSVITDPLSDCADPGSAGVTVIIREDATVSISSPETEVCVGADLDLTATVIPGSSFLELQWQSAPDAGGPWTDIPGETNAIFTAPTNILGTVYYRVNVTDSADGCADPESNIIGISVQGDVEVIAFADNAEVCVDGSVELTAQISGGSSQLTLFWQNAPAINGPWTDIAGATDTTYMAPTTVAGTFYYRIRIDEPNGTCNSPISNPLQVLVRADATVSVDAPNAEICVGGQISLSATVTGGSSIITYQWQSGTSISGPWTDISGETNSAYITAAVVADTFYYRVVIDDASSGCSDPVSSGAQVIVNPDATLSAAVNNAQVCIGGDATLTATVAGGSSALTLQWQSAPSTSGPWANLTGVTNAIFVAPTNTVGTFYYRVRVIDPLDHCSDPISSPITVVVRPDATVSANVNNAAVCIGGVATLTATLTGGSTSASVQWQSGPTGTGPWTDISGATNLTYPAPTSMAGTTYYSARVIDPNSGCATPTSNAMSVVVTESAQISASVDNAEVCVGGSVIATATLTGGSAAATLQWQSGTSSTGPWTNISGATNAMFNPSTLVAGTFYYHVVVNDPNNNCADPVSATLTVLVNEDVVVSVSASNSEVCIGGVSQLAANITGGSAALTMQWQNSGTTSGPWIDIANATNATYDAPTGSSGTTYYRIVLSDSNSGCASPTSSVVSVIVSPDATISAVVNNAEVCVGGSVALTATLTGGSSAATLQWQSSATSGGPWNDISGATSTIYNAPTGTPGTVYYIVRVIDPNNGCATPVSNEISVVVNPDATISASANNPEVCVDGDATLTAVLTGGSGSVSIQWQSGSSASGPWTDISGQTNLTYVAPTTTPGTYYYKVQVLDPNSGCAVPASNPVTVLVRADAAITAAVNNASVCVGGSAVLTATLTGGSTQAILQWQSGPSISGPWTDISGATGTTYASPTTATGTFYYSVRVIDPVEGCSTPESNGVSVEVFPDATISAVVDNAEVCVGGSAVITATVNGGSSAMTLQWQIGSSLVGPWSDISGSTNTTYAPLTNTPGTFFYRIQVVDPFNGCANPASAVIQLVVRADAQISAAVNNAEVCTGGSALLTATLTGGSTSATLQWQSSASSGGPFTNIGGATATTYSASTGTAGTTYYQVVVSDPNSGCASPTSNEVSVIVNEDAQISIAASDDIVCIDGVVALTATVTGGSSSATVQWQSGNGINGPWVDVSGGVGLIYSAPTSTAGSYFYRARVIDPLSDCADPASPGVEITVEPDATIEASSTDDEVCVGANVVMTAVLTGGSAMATLQWEIGGSETGPWSDIGGATNTTYNAPSGTIGVYYYRVRVIDSPDGCSEPESDPLTLVVSEDAQISASVNNTEVCIDGDATLQATVTGGSSQVSIQWESGTSATGPWTDIVDEVNNTFVSPTSVAGTFYYRVRITDPINGCDTPFSNGITITVNPDVVVSASADHDDVCIGGFVVMSADITGGSTSLQYHWQSSPDGIGSWTDVGVGNTDYVIAPSAAGTFYYRVRIEDGVSGCLEIFSDVITIIVHPDATVSASSDYATVCEGQLVTMTATLTGGSGSVSYHWQSSPNGSSGWADIGVSDMAYNPPTGTDGVFYYRVRVSDPNTGCAEPVSSVITLTIINPVTLVPSGVWVRALSSRIRMI
jgi:hypothetical protein